MLSYTRMLQDPLLLCWLFKPAKFWPLPMCRKSHSQGPGMNLIWHMAYLDNLDVLHTASHILPPCRVPVVILKGREALESNALDPPWRAKQTCKKIYFRPKPKGWVSLAIFSIEWNYRITLLVAWDEIVRRFTTEFLQNGTSTISLPVQFRTFFLSIARFSKNELSVCILCTSWIDPPLITSWLCTLSLAICI